MRLRLSVILSLTSAGCSLLLSDGYSNGDRASAPSEDAGAGGSTDADGAPDSGQPGPRPARSRYAEAVLADEPLAYYPLDEGTGVGVRDATGNGHDGRLAAPANATWAVPGATAGTGTAVRLGSRDGISVGDDFDFPGRVECSFEAWVRPAPDIYGWRRIFDKLVLDGGPVDGTYFYLHPDEAGLRLERWSSGTNVQTAGGLSDLPANRFSHVVGVITTEQVFIYVDGVRVGEGLVQGSVPATPVVAQWGVDFFGDFDELAIYAHALSAERVRAHYEAAMAAP